MNLELLLAHADDQRPVLDGGLPLEEAASAAGRDQHKQVSFRDRSGNQNDLAEQGWSVVAPEGPDGDALLERIAPLLRQRAEDQGGEIVPYRVAAGMSRDAATRWRTHVFNDGRPESELPGYLLILGDVDQVSLEFQQVMTSEAWMGRLVCPSPDGYTAYVEKLLRWEGRPSAEAEARALFFTARDRTAATTIGHSALVAPSIERCREIQGKGKLRAREIVEIGYEDADAAKDAFLAQVAGDDPSMLFTMSHGLGAPRGGWKSTHEQHRLQGAMSMGSGVRLTAEEMENTPFLPGGIWFFLACYGGGTPSASAYFPWLSRLRDAGAFGGRAEGVLGGLPKEGDRPFIAALPQAALANPSGPLAVMAHMDLAWTYSFQDMGPDGKARPGRFEGLFSALVDGKRAGPAHKELIHHLITANYDLTSMYSEEASAETAGKPIPPDVERARRKANLWMLREDIAGYVLLGDPAARLPLDRSKRAAKRAPAVPHVGSAPVAAAHVASAPAAVPPVPAAAPRPARDVEGMEKAVHAMIEGSEAPKAIAAEHGITRDELKRWHEAYCAAGRDALGKLP